MRLWQLDNTSIVNEGVIDVPDKFMDMIFIELLKAVSTSTISLSDSPKYISNLFLKIYKRHGVQFKYHGNEYDIVNNPNHYITLDITYPSVWFKYSTKTEMKKLSLSFSNLSRSTLPKGFFSPRDEVGEDILSINVSKLLKSIAPAVEIGDIVNPMEEEDAIDFVNDVVGMDINMIMDEHLPQILTTMEHESAHLIQYNFLSHPEQRQSHTSDTTSKYWTSNVEFSPQIISSARNIENVIEQYDVEGHVHDIFRYVVTMITASEFVRRTGIHDTQRILDNSVSFFLMLKENKPSNYKKAVKILYDELSKRIVF